MKPKEWRERYIVQLQKRGELTREQAEDILIAGMGEHDYNDNPEDAADAELSCWTDDE